MTPSAVLKRGEKIDPAAKRNAIQISISVNNMKGVCRLEKCRTLKSEKKTSCNREQAALFHQAVITTHTEKSTSSQTGLGILKTNKPVSFSTSKPVPR